MKKIIVIFLPLIVLAACLGGQERAVDKELINQLDYIIDTEQSFDSFSYKNFLYEWTGEFKNSGDTFTIFVFEGTDIPEFPKDQLKTLGLLMGKEMHFKDNLAIGCDPDSPQCKKLINDLNRTKEEVEKLEAEAKAKAWAETKLKEEAEAKAKAEAEAKAKAKAEAEAKDKVNAYSKAKEFYNLGNYSEAFKYFKYVNSDDEEKYDESNYYLGFMSMEGMGTDENYLVADKFLRISAQSNIDKISADSKALKGIIFINNQNYSEAAKWLRMAIEQNNNVIGQFYLAYLYKNGLGTPVNLPKALNFFELAAAKGYEGSAEEVLEVKKLIEADTRVKKEAEAKAEAEVEAEANAKLKAEAEAKAKAEAEQQAKQDAAKKNPNAIVLPWNTTTPKAPDQKGSDNKTKLIILKVNDLEKEFDLNSTGFRSKYSPGSSIKISGEIGRIDKSGDLPGIRFAYLNYYSDLSIHALFSSMDVIANLTVGQNIIVNCLVSHYSIYMELNNCSIE